MADSFHCPKCNASYPHDKRRVGKAVVCTCGHRFLVPPLDYAAPQANTPHDASVTPQPRSPRRATPPAERPPSPRPANRPAQPKSRPARRKTRRTDSSDSSSEVLPLAEPLGSTPPAGSARWADPVDSPQEAPLMEAEVVQPGDPFAEPEDLTGNLFNQNSPYATPVGSYPPPLVDTHLPVAAARRRGKKSRGAEGSKTFSDWVAYAVLFFFLPVSALLTLVGLLQPAPGAGDFAAPDRIVPRDNSPWQTSTPANPPVAAEEPPPSGYPITLWNAAKGASGEFSVQYRQDRGPIDRSRQYYWVIADASGQIEFPIPADVWKNRHKLSGRPAEAGPGQFVGPYSTFIEEQVGSSRSRISNDVQVVVAQ